MSSKPNPPRIASIIARKAPMAVVFRRGPSRHMQMLHWDMNKDVITPGQWIRAHVYIDKCDLSPDGRYLVTRMSDYNSGRKRRASECRVSEEIAQNWTAVSRPPYFTAIALWFHESSYFGGGLWRSNNHIELSAGGLVIESKRPPKSIQVSYRESGRHDWIAEAQLNLMGWKPATYEARSTIDLLPAEKTFSGGQLRRFEAREAKGSRTVSKEVWQALGPDGKLVLEWKLPPNHPQFVDIDHRGRVVFGDKGCLWAWEGFPEGEPTLIADLNENIFENVAPPAWALEW